MKLRYLFLKSFVSSKHLINKLFLLASLLINFSAVANAKNLSWRWVQPDTLSALQNQASSALWEALEEPGKTQDNTLTFVNPTNNCSVSFKRSINNQFILSINDVEVFSSSAWWDSMEVRAFPLSKSGQIEFRNGGTMEHWNSDTVTIKYDIQPTRIKDKPAFLHFGEFIYKKISIVPGHSKTYDEKTETISCQLNVFTNKAAKLINFQEENDSILWKIH